MPGERIDNVKIRNYGAAEGGSVLRARPGSFLLAYRQGGIEEGLSEPEVAESSEEVEVGLLEEFPGAQLVCVGEGGATDVPGADVIEGVGLGVESGFEVAADKAGIW